MTGLAARRAAHVGVVLGVLLAACSIAGGWLSWEMGGESGRVRTEKEIHMWKVARGAAGRLPPQGFPRDNKF